MTHDGYNDKNTAQPMHVEDKIPEHHAGNRRTANRPPPRLPVQAETAKAPRIAGHRPHDAADRRLRKWVLLAPTPKLPVRIYAQIPQSLLAEKIRGKH